MWQQWLNPYFIKLRWFFVHKENYSTMAFFDARSWQYDACVWCRCACDLIFVFFAHKKYSRSFIKLRLTHWCHMDYFNDVLSTFLGLERVSCIAVYGVVRKLSQKYLNLCSKDERRAYRFGTTQGWVINEIIFILGWIIFLIYHLYHNTSGL